METARIIIIFLLFVVTACAGDDKENIGHSLSHRWNLSSVVELEFVGDDFGDDEEFKTMTIDQLKEEYNKKFPLLLANFFENLAKYIKSGELEIKTEF